VYVGSPEGTRIAGLGAARMLAAAGPRRFSRLQPLLDALPAGLPALVGFSYDPEGPVSPEWSGHPAATALVPQMTVVREGGRSRLIVAVPPGARPRAVLEAAASLRVPDEPVPPRGPSVTVTADPAAGAWRDAVAEAVGAAEAGTIAKVVLARSVRVSLGDPIPAFDVVALLARRYPDCRVFGWQSGEATFVGASPELLVARRGSRFHTVALAGSAARSTSPEADRRLADGLLAGEKDRSEHAIVVEEIARRLAPLADVIDVPAVPVVERFATVQHLSTPIVGRTGAAILELASALHPTPAVGGHPTPEAVAFQSKLEQIDRGWYSGGIGWADAAGDGEIAVALRSALMTGDRAILYAGNGIVVGSDPDAELEETRLKLRPLLDLLSGA
jgi:isochorismate synthase